MRTKELEQEKIYYKNIQQLIEAGCVEKVRYSYYQWGNPDDLGEIGTVCCLFPYNGPLVKTTLEEIIVNTF